MDTATATAAPGALPARVDPGARAAEGGEVRAAAGGSLGLHEEIGRLGCSRWPEALRLRSSTGELVKGRCGSTNLCRYCARLAAVENSEVLALDAIENSAPELWAVLGTRSVDPRPASYKLAKRYVAEAIKRRWPAAEFAVHVEFTTGYGPRSGGRRRPHWNWMIKGVPVADVDELRAVMTAAWCRHVDALPERQVVATIYSAGGLMRYLALHFQKESQAPPAGWRGHRFTHSRGYFAEGIVAMRAQARRSLRFKRELYKLDRACREQTGEELDAATLHEFAGRAVELSEAKTWKLVQVQETLGAVLHRPVGRAVRR